MTGLIIFKESLFGVFHVVNESFGKSETGPWQLRWCVLGYVLDTVQVNLYIFSIFQTVTLLLLLGFANIN